MPRVADGEPPAGSKESGHDCRSEGRRLGKRDELLVEQAHKFCLIQAIDEPAHQSSQVGGGGGNRGSMTGDVGEQQAGDSAGGTTRSVINIAAALRLPEGLAENPE